MYRVSKKKKKKVQKKKKKKKKNTQSEWELYFKNKNKSWTNNVNL